MRLHLAGHYWSYSEPRRITWDGEAIDGICVQGPRREIRVVRRLPIAKKAEIQLHELCHASNFSASEQWVTTWSSGTTALMHLAGVGLARVRTAPDGKETIRKVLFHALRIGRHDLDDDRHLQAIADDLTRALLRLGWRQLTPK